MLANLLPGFRDLRTPLASGYIWLVVLWLLFRGQLQRGPLEDLYETSQLLGQSVLLGVLSFLAFLLGSLLQLRIVRDGGRLRRFGRHLYSPAGKGSKTQRAAKSEPTNASAADFANNGTTDAEPNATGSSIAPAEDADARRRRRVFTEIRNWLLNYRILQNLYSQLDRWIDSRLDPKLESTTRRELAILLSQGNEGLTPGARILQWKLTPPDTSKAPLSQLYIEALSFELEPISIRLQAENEKLWDTYDRHCAEEQFRYTLSVPLVALVVVVACQLGQGAWLAVLILPVLLFIHGLRHSAAATSVLVQAVVLGIVKPDALSNLESSGDRNATQVATEAGSAAARV